MEEYKEIKGFEDYQVSNYGNIKSLITNIILRPRNNNKGYYLVCLYKDGKKYYKLVHRLVAEAFIPNPDNLPCVNHKDENTQNNHVDNLEWCTQKYNINYGSRTEKCAAKRSNPVIAIDVDGNVVHEFASIREAGRNGFNFGNVSQCCNKCFHRQGNNFYKDCYWYFKEDWFTKIG